MVDQHRGNGRKSLAVRIIGHCRQADHRDHEPSEVRGTRRHTIHIIIAIVENEVLPRDLIVGRQHGNRLGNRIRVSYWMQRSSVPRVALDLLLREVVVKPGPNRTRGKAIPTSIVASPLVARHAREIEQPLLRHTLGRGAMTTLLAEYPPTLQLFSRASAPVYIGTTLASHL
jgi:hypothetical protein